MQLRVSQLDVSRYNTHQNLKRGEAATQPTTRRSRRNGVFILNRLLLSLAVLIILTAPALYAADVKETIHVVITGGPNAGTYDGTTDRGGCSAGMTGKDSWGNQYSLVKENNPKVLNSLQLSVPDAKEAARGTHNFFLNVAFGRITARVAEYKVETEKKSGSGTVTVNDKGTTAVVTFDATTAAGVRLQGTIDCKSVLRAP
jgi:opacity protein-like surface antigen